jgi:glycosyltransferase involved in cell wall biosynthesis
MIQPAIVTSDAYTSPENRDRPSVVTTHMFQDSFGALPGRLNGVGGSATVHALQAQELGDRGIMVAPSHHLGKNITGLHLPAVAYGFAANSETQHDAWYEEPNLRFLTERVMGGHTGRNDVVYAHMPISGQVGMDFCRSNNNPLVYLGHAWEILSATFFPDRAIKSPRLATEYALIDYLASKPGRGFIVTNSQWEADAVAEAYSKAPTAANLGAFMKATAGRHDLPSRIDTLAMKALDDIRQGRTRILSKEQIKALCLPNPIGIDGAYYSDAYRAQHRADVRAEFFTDHNMPEDAIVIGGVGRIHPQKDPFASVEVFHKAWDLLGRPDDLFLLLAGPGDKDTQGQATGYYERLLHFIDTEHVEVAQYIRVPGSAVDARDINSLLDIRLCTATFETWGLSFQESLCMGVPSVARANPVYSELYGASGIIMESDPNKLAEGIVELVNNPWKREQYGKMCGMVGNRYNWKRSVGELQDKLRDRLNFPI